MSSFIFESLELSMDHSIQKRPTEVLVILFDREEFPLSAPSRQMFSLITKRTIHVQVN